MACIIDVVAVFSSSGPVKVTTLWFYQWCVMYFNVLLQVIGLLSHFYAFFSSIFWLLAVWSTDITYEHMHLLLGWVFLHSVLTTKAEQVVASFSVAMLSFPRTSENVEICLKCEYLAMTQNVTVIIPLLVCNVWLMITFWRLCFNQAQILLCGMYTGLLAGFTEAAGVNVIMPLCLQLVTQWISVVRIKLGPGMPRYLFKLTMNLNLI